MKQRPMKLGLSTNRHCDLSADCLVQAGRQFVFRYHSRTTTQPQKRLTPAEAAALARAGLEIACVYQDRAREESDFDFERGRFDALSASTYAAQVGQPRDSAIYFAVDVDFSLAQVDKFVVPYFRGVQAGLSEAAGTQRAYAVGVYGSGLVCRRVRDEQHLATFSWLAEARAWRESSTYTLWDVRQSVNKAELCTLGTAWESCEARDDFGQFRPIGFEVASGTGEVLRVTAAQLNLRSMPGTVGNTPLVQLHEGQLVEVLGPAGGDWLRVRATIDNTRVIGYASARYLAAVPASVTVAAAPAAASIPAVHFRENDPGSKRSSTARRAQPIGEPDRPGRDASAKVDERNRQLLRIVDWLAVDTSLRYRPEAVTFCNVYAADVCYLAGVYLPRTWWTEAALIRLARGEQVPVQYGATIREMRADDLYLWLVQHGSAFGWQRVFDATALQAAADGGGLGVICADRDAEGRPGHICMVVPQHAGQQARLDADGNVVLPLQSQAGAVNFTYGTGSSEWWRDPKFKAYGFFVHR